MRTSLIVVLCLGLAGLAGGFAAPVGILAWMSLTAAACGAWMGRWARSPLAWTPPLVWAATLAFTRGIPDPLAASLSVAALYAVGMGAGAWLSPERTAAAALLVAATLSLAPTFGGGLERPWPAELSAALLDASPVAWTAESARIDWMRHPAVYDAAGTADIGPELRTGRRSWLAAVVLLVVGCLSSLAAKPRAAEESEA
ncbi:MAG: hypothetical protein MK291_12660 [Planctomycetes bacterium]|nr:hypothetical protein [Planctomycetota bacterium]